MTVLCLLLGLVGLLLLLILFAVIRTLLQPRKHSAYVLPAADERAARYAEILSRMVAYETVSVPDVDQRAKFLGFHALLQELFPLVHERLEKIELDGNLLFFWEGRQHDRPLVLMSHQDVVPAEGVWLHPPFSGEIADGKVWGRGASDTKCTVMAFFQAVEELLQQGFVPPQDVWLSSSCTEEYAGPGCPMLVEELKRRGVRPFLVCDEGGGIITDPIGGVPGNYAMMGVFEKGKADVRFTARSSGGHASAPPRNSPIARLAAFVQEMERRPPFRKQFEPEVRAMFERLAPYAGFGLRLMFSNFWLFGPLLKLVMPMVSNQAGAMLRTTIAFTMQSGSDACNVLPQEASVWANMRFIPHQGMEESLRLTRALAEKHGLEMDVLSASDYSAAADIEGEAWRLVVRVVEETFPGLPTSPYVMTGATDAKCYQEICDSCIRFAPVVYGPEQMKGMHGLNENIEIACLPGAVDFYQKLIRAMPLLSKPE
ncbi:MAG: M20/M25/M40 family metallo-hydrolase [Oscillospiraceae bacterium]|nr:M20/M25/M40 family metallo-hydrolase [Oscillospiraceae bacterium]